MTDVAATQNSEWDAFRCEVIPERDSVRVLPVGEIDLATADDVARPVRELLERGFEELVLDLSEVSFIDSSGIRMVLEVLETAQRHGVSLTLVPGPPVVHRAFVLTGLAEKLFP